MDDVPGRSPPAEWLEAVDAGRADIVARRKAVSAESVIAQLREREARLRVEAEPDTSEPTPRS